jgi:transcriptional regulator with XRE-family HTH domain
MRLDENYDIAQFAICVKIIRQQRKLSAIGLSRRAGLSHSYIANLEAGVYRDMKVSVLYAIATALGVSSGELLGF